MDSDTKMLHALTTIGGLSLGSLAGNVSSAILLGYFINNASKARDNKLIKLTTFHNNQLDQSVSKISVSVKTIEDQLEATPQFYDPYTKQVNESIAIINLPT